MITLIPTPATYLDILNASKLCLKNIKKHLLFIFFCDSSVISVICQIGCRRLHYTNSVQPT